MLKVIKKVAKKRGISTSNQINELLMHGLVSWTQKQKALRGATRNAGSFNSRQHGEHNYVN